MNSEHAKYLVANYATPPLEITKGKGSFLWDSTGKKYLDFTSGIAVTNIGHSHQHWINKVSSQTEKLVHCSNLFSIPEQVRLAKRLVQKIGPGKMLFCNSGAEANEALIKFSRLAGKKDQPHRHKLLVVDNAFHGRTMGALSATASKKYREGFEPLLTGFTFARLNDIESFAESVDEETVGIMIESIQGEGGVKVATDQFLQDLQKLCRERNLLLLLDEVQAGIGRTGEFLGFQKSGIHPDAVAIAKGLGGGFPIGAIWLSEKWADTFKPGSHGTTFGGSPLACSAANAVLDVIDEENLIQNSKSNGEYLLKRLEEFKGKYPKIISEIRGRGLMLAMVCHAPPTPLIEKLRERGLLVVGAAENAIRFLPPLNILKNDLDEALVICEQVLENFAK